jgi:hypothetical protein
MARMGILTNFEICCYYSSSSQVLIPVARTKEFVEAGEFGWSFVCSIANGSGLDVHNNFHEMYS